MFSSYINKYKYFIAFGLFIAYLCLTLYKLGDNSLWYDECFSIDWANDSIKEILDYSLLHDTNPPLYLIILHFWLKWFGDSEFVLRSLSAISASIACGVFFYLLFAFLIGKQPFLQFYYFFLK